MTNEEAKAKLEKVIDEMAVALNPVVAGIENGVAITQNNYDKYLQAFSGRKVAEAKVMFAALCKAGANKAGVAAAFKISFGFEPTA